MKRIILFAVILVSTLSSCSYFGKRIRGNGNVVRQERSFSGFTGARVNGAIHLYVRQDSSYSVTVQTDDNLQKYIRVEQKNGTLYVRQQNYTRLKPTGQIRVYVSAPLLKVLRASGASEIHGENNLVSDEQMTIEISGASEAELHLDAPSVNCELAGASKLSLSGQTKELRIDCSGASRAYCADLLSENTYVDLSGASHAEVFASVKLDAEASGASQLRYRGNAEISQRTSGAASIKKRD